MSIVRYFVDSVVAESFVFCEMTNRFVVFIYDSQSVRLYYFHPESIVKSQFLRIAMFLIFKLVGRYFLYSIPIHLICFSIRHAESKHPINLLKLAYLTMQILNIKGM